MLHGPILRKAQYFDVLQVAPLFVKMPPSDIRPCEPTSANYKLLLDSQESSLIADNVTDQTLNSMDHIHNEVEQGASKSVETSTSAVLTHKQQVCSLYKRALRNLEVWYDRRHIYRYQAQLLKKRFDELRCIKDLLKAQEYPKVMTPVTRETTPRAVKVPPADIFVAPSSNSKPYLTALHAGASAIFAEVYYLPGDIWIFLFFTRFARQIWYVVSGDHELGATVRSSASYNFTANWPQLVRRDKLNNQLTSRTLPQGARIVVKDQSHA
ncbi:uncharacterized protein LOC119648470 [Hermetia illucens]|uniref:uncharacterized protein LOC119648470 n=1 Tax=Hermetia illucens TaxID=343691 RepID=UPI0018CC1884|nr:uncharacterized protein LOC119648470 [Hermetia illucens]